MTETDHKQTYNNTVRPDRIVRVKHGSGRNASFETIGAAWSQESGAEYVKLHGKQVIDQGFYIFDLKSNAPEEKTPDNSME